MSEVISTAAFFGVMVVIFFFAAIINSKNESELQARMIAEEIPPDSEKNLHFSVSNGKFISLLAGAGSLFFAYAAIDSLFRPHSGWTFISDSIFSVCLFWACIDHIPFEINVSGDMIQYKRAFRPMKIIEFRHIESVKAITYSRFGSYARYKLTIYTAEGKFCSVNSASCTGHKEFLTRLKQEGFTINWDS